jgi:hypothetical protein
MALPHLLVRRYERCLLLSAKRQTDSAVANLWHESTRIIRAPWVHPTSGTVDLHAMTEALLAATFERALPQKPPKGVRFARRGEPSMHRAWRDLRAGGAHEQLGRHSVLGAKTLIRIGSWLLAERSTVLGAQVGPRPSQPAD